MRCNQISDKLRESVKRFFKRFEDQIEAVTGALVATVNRFPVACISLYGSVLTGVGPNSDVDVMVLIKDNYKDLGFNLLELRLDLEDVVDAARVNETPVDLHVSVVSSFVDLTRDTEFKCSFSENNIVVWEDGESLGSKIVKQS